MNTIRRVIVLWLVLGAVVGLILIEVAPSLIVWVVVLTLVFTITHVFWLIAAAWSEGSDHDAD